MVKMKFKYYIYIKKKNEKHECLYFDSLSEAMKRYKATEMKSLDESVFLGIQSEDISPTSGMCFDVLHKFFGEHILINDYLNHDCKEVRSEVKKILNKIVVKYQFTSNLLGGVLIPFYEDWSGHRNDMIMKKEWCEAYVLTCENNEMVYKGWQPYGKETQDKYGWQYPNIASIVIRLNVICVDDNGVNHEIDADPREFLRNHGYRFSNYKDFI